MSDTQSTPTPASIECPVDECKVTGSVPGIRRHVSRTHGIEKAQRDALVDQQIAGLSTSTATIAPQENHLRSVHWTEGASNEELRQWLRGQHILKSKDTSREDLLTAVAKREAKLAS
jgi:hypothetical protein